MTMPFYVAPEQVMKDRADYARKGIARGRRLAGLVYDDGVDGHPDQLYHILYDGTVVDEQEFSVLGGEAETIAERLKEGFTEGMALSAALQAAVKALGGPERTLEGSDLEVAVLAR